MKSACLYNFRPLGGQIITDGAAPGIIFVFRDAANFLFDPDEELSDEGRISRLKFHVEKDDYFGHLATILCLMTQDKSLCADDLLNKYVLDLKYMQKHYQIEAREQPKTPSIPVS